MILCCNILKTGKKQNVHSANNPLFSRDLSVWSGLNHPGNSEFVILKKNQEIVDTKIRRVS